MSTAFTVNVRGDDYEVDFDRFGGCYIYHVWTPDGDLLFDYSSDDEITFLSTRNLLLLYWMAYDSGFASGEFSKQLDIRKALGL